MAGGSLGTGNVTRQNIIIGPGNMYFASVGTAIPAAITADSADDALTILDADNNWTHVGATMEGVEVGYAPDFGEVVVDQLKDAAKLFNQGVDFTMSTQLAEVTLLNLALAWGQNEADVLTTNTTTDTFNICVPDDNPTEYQVIVVGEGPPSDPTADSATNEGKTRDRVYIARRATSVEGSTHSLRRTDATVFPVSFRCLPDSDFVGSEYGQIIDRVKTV